MPSLSSYTPFESLLFFQSLAAHESKPATFSAISELLQNNPFVRQDVTFDTSRLSPQALEDLYTTLITEGLDSGDEKTAAQQSNNPKKRKVAVPSLQDGASHANIVPSLVSHLYARYKDRATSEIKHEEKRYLEIKDEITQLENAPEQTSTDVLPQSTAGTEKEAPEDQPLQDSATTANAAEPTGAAAGVVPPPPPDTGVEKASPSFQQPSQPEIAPSIPKPDGVPKTTQNVPLSAPVEQGATGQQGRNGYQQIHPKREQTTRKIQPAPAATKATTHPPIQPYQQSAQFPNPAFSTAGPSPPVSLAPSATQQPPNGTAPLTSPSLAGQPQGQRAPSSAEQPQVWPSPSHPNQVHANQHIPPYPNEHAPREPFPATPSTPYTPITPSGTVQGPPYPVPPAQNQQPADRATPAQPASLPPATSVEIPASTNAEPTSFAKSLSRRRTITPWKMPDPITIPQRPASPVQPRPEDISPISSRSPSPVPQRPPVQRRRGAAAARKSTPTPREKSAASQLSPSAVRSTRSRSRGLSATSRDEEFAPDTALSQTQIKKEVPSTPAGLSDEGVTRSGMKRKQPSDEEHPSSAGLSNQYVVCTRNFGRTCAPIMNDVAAHKYASIFAKPLTERDAPGYRNLIYRPQDIKSIKSAIHQGNRVVAAAWEGGDSAAESPAPGSSTGPPPSKSNGLVLKKTSELCPPKGIVQSSQLEMELIRMFANAIMFNPTPEQTFGPAFPMRTDSASREGTQSSAEPEEGGIINDTLEMYDDVEKAVSTWRAAERAADDNRSLVALRQGSSSDANMDGADDTKGS